MDSEDSLVPVLRPLNTRRLKIRMARMSAAQRLVASDRLLAQTAVRLANGKAVLSRHPRTPV